MVISGQRTRVTESDKGASHAPPFFVSEVDVFYSEIKDCDIANGVGVRVSLFVSGCRHRCKGCFNEVAWPFDSGKPFTKETEDEIVRLLGRDHIAGLSILGGEPLEPENQRDVLRLLERASDAYPDKDVWLWTGFTFEDLMAACSDSDATCRAATPVLWDLLRHVDVMVDGLYIDEERDITLRFRGSPNQRILDMQRSLTDNSPMLWTDGSVLGTRKWSEE